MIGRSAWPGSCELWEVEPFSGCPVAALHSEAPLHVVSECGHFVHLEQPGITLDLMTDFFTNAATR